MILQSYHVVAFESDSLHNRFVGDAQVDGEIGPGVHGSARGMADLPHERRHESPFLCGVGHQRSADFHVHLLELLGPVRPRAAGRRHVGTALHAALNRGEVAIDSLQDIISEVP